MDLVALMPRRNEKDNAGGQQPLLREMPRKSIMPFDVCGVIERSPLPVLARMHLERAYIVAAKRLKRVITRKTQSAAPFVALVRNNRLYGDEEILRDYAGRSDDLLAIIEHGVYFGNNTSKVGIEQEWDLGCILTNGDYRKYLLAKHYPEYYCEAIGPMIAYAKPDVAFAEALDDLIPASTRMALFFPVHASGVYRLDYDAASSFEDALTAADALDCEKVIVCVLQYDIEYYSSIARLSSSPSRFEIVTCGDRYSKSFLCRQRALIERADVTMSNALGTHLGYCVYLGKPHVLSLVDYSYVGSQEVMEREFGLGNISANHNRDISEERKEAARLFSLGNLVPNSQMRERQWQACDWYWGFSHVKTPEEVSMLYDICKVLSDEFRFRKMKTGNSCRESA